MIVVNLPYSANNSFIEATTCVPTVTIQIVVKRVKVLTRCMGGVYKDTLTDLICGKMLYKAILLLTFVTLCCSIPVKYKDCGRCGW